MTNETQDAQNPLPQDPAQEARPDLTPATAPEAAAEGEPAPAKVRKPRARKAEAPAADESAKGEGAVSQ